MPVLDCYDYKIRYMYKFTYKRPFENMPILLEHFNAEICISSLKIMTADFITYIQKVNNQRRFVFSNL